MPRDPDATLYADGIFRSLFPAKVERPCRSRREYRNIRGHRSFRPRSSDHCCDILAGKQFQETRGALMATYRALKVMHGCWRSSANGSMGDRRKRRREVDGWWCSVYRHRSADSDLPLTGVFVPLFLRSVQYLAGNIITGGQYTAGERIRETIRSLTDIEVMTIRAGRPSAHARSSSRGEGGAVQPGRR